MDIPEVVNKYTRSRQSGETNSGESLVERAGYVDAKSRIERMMSAGQRLVASRQVEFDFPQGTEIDESFVNPTRSGNYDMADAYQTALALEQKRRRVVEPLQNASKASQSDPNPKGSDSPVTAPAVVPVASV
jgi:hypothetical protein